MTQRFGMPVIVLAGSGIAKYKMQNTNHENSDAEPGKERRFGS
jgi:hypothetical protein